MKIVISPAKSLNYESKLPVANYSESAFLKNSELIQKTLKNKQPKELMELMHISEKLADLNWKRNQEWSVPFSKENARPAVFAFDGDSTITSFLANFLISVAETFFNFFNLSSGEINSFLKINC